ncbi:MAG: hypothetical protein JSV19_06445 [Phycisphaerales bacterium]|nr:MAG: hypothetical protein JSV19_06445 [Phycisphaerales bacterium]
MCNLRLRNGIIGGLLAVALLFAFSMTAGGCMEDTKSCVKQHDQSKCGAKCDPAKCPHAKKASTCAKAKTEKWAKTKEHATGEKAEKKSKCPHAEKAQKVEKPSSEADDK